MGTDQVVSRAVRSALFGFLEEMSLKQRCAGCFARRARAGADTSIFRRHGVRLLFALD
jgi:hypothetical protein